MSSIFEFVKKQRDDYRTETISITEGYDFSQYETLRTIELYHNSKFLSGNKDSLDREKPFYNVCKFRVNVAVRATDLDTKDVQIESTRVTKTSYAESFLLNLKNRNWMKDARFGVFLNKLTQVRAKYGGVLVKKIESDNSLELHVMDWNNVITDQVDIRKGVKIERRSYNPSELKTDAPKEWKNLDEAIELAKKSREANAADPNAKENGTPGANVVVYEVHGVLPTCYLAKTSDKYPEGYGSEDEYARMMFAVVLDESKEDTTDGIVLFAGREGDDCYKYKEYEEVPGRGLGVGVVEDLFEAQVWTNDSVKKKKDILELAGKWIGQTADQNIAAKNILTDFENGQLLTHADGKPITQVNNSPTSLPAFDKLVDEWNTQAERVSSTFNAITGETMPSGTPYRQTAILNQEAGSLFEYRREEAGLFVQEIYQDWILPFIVKQIRKDKELTATLEPEELERLSNAIADHEATDFAKEQILTDNLAVQQDIDAVHEAARETSMKRPRQSLGQFKDLFKDDWEGRADVITTGEQKNKAAVLETVNNAIKFVVAMQLPDGRNLVMEDGVMRDLFLQLMEFAGISPVLFGKRPGASSPAPTPVIPTSKAPAEAVV